MEPDLAAFLARHTPLATQDAAWMGGALGLRIASCLCAEPPPIAYVNSVRCIVFQGDSVLVIRGIRGPTDLHIVPGGRREGDETLEETLRREVLEETGWTVTNAALLGFSHFHILDRPPDYAYPHSGFINLIFTADAVSHDPGALRVDDVEIGLGFYSLADVQSLDLSPAERCFLDAALARRGGSSDPARGASVV
jgi:8-oxo-dGTP diphosphatase